MAKKQTIKHAVNERIAYGYSRQMVFDEIRAAEPELPLKKVAHRLRYTPSQAERRYYAPYRNILLAVVIVGVFTPLLLRMWSGELTIQRPGPILSALPFASLFLLASIFRWNGEAFAWMAALNAFSSLGALGTMNQLFTNDPDLLLSALRLLPIVTAALSGYLYLKLFRAPVEAPGTDGQLYIFSPDPVDPRMG